MKELGFQSHLINVSSVIEDWREKERASQLINVSSVIEGQREKERVRESAFLEGERESVPSYHLRAFVIHGSRSHKQSKGSFINSGKSLGRRKKKRERDKEKRLERELENKGESVSLG